MNNILSFNEYNGQEIRQIEAEVFEQMLNEKSSLNSGIRGFFNRRASRKIKEELEDEIEMSKTIMEGIQKGLESLNESFDGLRDELSKTDTDNKNEKQKTLDDIMKIIEESRKNTWDLNSLIDEGEIDYSGFTANIGIASVAYFGILLTPFRAAVMVHKGYSYFFNIIKNTIRKALVMLQLNYDQFENLIITKSFQSLDYLQDQDTSVKISEFYGKLESKLFDKKSGLLTGKKGSNMAKEQMQLAKQQIDAMMKADKSKKLSDNAYNCLDQYNNTYTRSLETLRQYTQDDVQKQLDSLKNSMNKLAGQDVDLQTYGELIIAAAEEHAYKVSSSIYNKFGKLTEAFSLPNQKKLIDLIQAATKEDMDNAEKEKREKKEADAIKKAEELKEKVESDGVRIFKKISGSEIGDIDEETGKYDPEKIKADHWTYEEFKDLDEEDQDSFETWLQAHPEVLKKCGPTLRVAIYSPYNDAYHDYVDSLVDYIGPCIEEIDESYVILNFDEYRLNESEERDLSSIDKSRLREIKDMIDDASSYGDFKASMFGSKDHKFTEEDESDLEDCILILSDDKDYKGNKKYDKWVDNLNICLRKAKNINRKTVKIDFSEISTRQSNDLKEMYVEDKDGEDMTDVAITALEVIGKVLLKDKTFVKNAKDIVGVIQRCLKEKSVQVSPVTYKIFTESIAKLKELRNADYFDAEEESKKKSED